MKLGYWVLGSLRNLLLTSHNRAILSAEGFETEARARQRRRQLVALPHRRRSITKRHGDRREAQEGRKRRGGREL